MSDTKLTVSFIATGDEADAMLKAQKDLNMTPAQFFSLVVGIGTTHIYGFAKGKLGFEVSAATFWKAVAEAKRHNP